MKCGGPFFQLFCEQVSSTTSHGKKKQKEAEMFGFFPGEGLLV